MRYYCPVIKIPQPDCKRGGQLAHVTQYIRCLAPKARLLSWHHAWKGDAGKILCMCRSRARSYRIHWQLAWKSKVGSAWHTKWQDTCPCCTMPPTSYTVATYYAVSLPDHPKSRRHVEYNNNQTEKLQWKEYLIQFLHTLH
jgi:hypothetical protein